MLAAVDMTTDRCHNNSQAPNSIAAARKSLAQLLDACDKSRVFAAGRRPFARIYRRLVAVLVRFLGSSTDNGRVARDLRSPDSIVVLLRDSESRDEARLLLLSFLQTLASVAKRRGPAAFVQHAPSLAGGGVASGMLVARPPKNDQKSAKDHPR